MGKGRRVEQTVEPASVRSLLSTELLGTTAGHDEMSITRDLIAVARDRATHTRDDTTADLEGIPRQDSQIPPSIERNGFGLNIRDSEALGYPGR
jgi:hypothetical protein